jgi:hypothetical protein
MKKAIALDRNVVVPEGGLLADLRNMIADAREQVARTVNAGLSLLYWQIGRRIRQEVLFEKRAD